jgi:2-polyprenyl-3-methyl-5-hydroxy-6-metoxy-1,4-benzoquinol methylase
MTSGRIQLLKEAIGLLPARGVSYDCKSIADIGCGTGHLLLEVSKVAHGATFTGYEYAEEALKVAKSVMPSCTFGYFDIYEGTPERFDVVFCTEVLEHLLFPDNALRTLLTMLKPGGATVLTVPHGRIDTYEGHINFWSPESWRVFIESNARDLKTETEVMIGGRNLFAIVWAGASS